MEDPNVLGSQYAKRGGARQGLSPVPAKRHHPRKLAVHHVSPPPLPPLPPLKDGGMVGRLTADATVHATSPFTP
ncbi:hypothetical protein E2C01_075323 [Portunus trituberculatus]|uniref:Uncharacterized protein n=1 Tax=Portunus trituberculatus TaxID=210409 RepID=A0A5B7IET4_PORTR|nr:hypothetical protein [Portunus trituberculatus]